MSTPEAELTKPAVRSLEEIHAVYRRLHPDWKPNSGRKLRVGPLISGHDEPDSKKLEDLGMLSALGKH